MILTPPQREAANKEGSCLVVACPGSGKTRTIVAKLLRSIDEVRDTSQRVACITYTNAAVEEIESRLAVYGQHDDTDYCTISTIHAFCLQEVLSRFHWKLPRYGGGFTVAPPDSKEFLELAEQAAARFGTTLTLKMREGLEQISRELDGTPIIPAGFDLADEMVANFLTRLGERGLITFTDIVYLSLKLLQAHPSLARALACRFAWILIDEFQDTNVLQVELMRTIASHQKTKFFLVGDPHQSIYRFAGARPDLMSEFAKDVGAKEIPLTGNFRSSSLVVRDAQLVLPREPEMIAVGRNRDFPVAPEHHHVDRPFAALTDFFLPALAEHSIPFGNAAILAPWWTTLIPLGRALREYQVPVLGPGARPYKRRHLLGRIAEQVCAGLDVGGLSRLPQIERELFRLVTEVFGRPNFTVFSYRGRRTASRLLRVGAELREEYLGAVEWLHAAAKVFGQVLEEDGFGTPALTETLKQSALDIEEEIRARGQVDADNMLVEDIGLLGNRQGSLRLMTIHASKGQEFDAVALVDLHEGKIPHWTARTQEEYEEGQRLLYVGMTRARRVLMYVTDTTDNRNRPSRFLRVMDQ